MNLKHNRGGMTLIEIMLILSLSILTALTLTQLLYHTTHLAKALLTNMHHLNLMTHKFAALERDLNQAFNDAAKISGSSQHLTLQHLNNSATSTSTQCVSYQIAAEQLLRVSWPAGHPDHPSTLILDQAVAGLHWQYLDTQQRQYQSWPPPTAARLASIKLIIKHHHQASETYCYTRPTYYTHPAP